jgi:hypothetical protein
LYKNLIANSAQIILVDKPSISSGPTDIVECNPLEQPLFICVAIGQKHTNILWTYVSRGAEWNLTDGESYQIKIDNSQMKDGLYYTINSTLTFLSMASNEHAIVRCKTDIPGAASADALLVAIGKYNNQNNNYSRL